MNIMNTLKHPLLAAALLALSINTALATQYLQADESKPLTAVVSSRSMTRVSVEGGRIINARFLDGELDLQKDEISGQVYVKPISKTKKISLFVTSDSSKTYLILLSPTGSDADSIVIQERTAQTNQLQQMQRQQASIPQAVSNKEDSYTRSVKAFMIAMANNNTAGFGVQRSPSHAEVPLWKEVLFIRKNRYSGSDLYGESYTLTNITKEQIVLAEQEFFKAKVLAVAVRKLLLNPGEQTEVFIITSGGSQKWLNPEKPPEKNSIYLKPEKNSWS